MARTLTVTADGGSRGNPGPAAFGAVVFEGSTVLAEIWECIGVATNNVAEYRGLVAGLTAAHEIDPTAHIEVKMDSKLVVEQMSGRWQIKHPDMRTLASTARSIHPMSLITFSWIPREQNSHADGLVNRALDNDTSGNEQKLIQRNFLHSRMTSNEVPTTLYLIRHGETPLTPERRFSGSDGSNPSLTEKGIAQAQAVARLLKPRNPIALYVSPLQRTQETAAEISRETGLTPILDDDFREVSFGKWDGHTPDEIAQKYPDEFMRWVSDPSYKQGGGESYAAGMVRAGEAIHKLTALHPGETIAVVTHNVVIKGAVCFAMSAPIDSIFHVDIAPCSITTIKIWPSDGLTALFSMSEASILG